MRQREEKIREKEVELQAQQEEAMKRQQEKEEYLRREWARLEAEGSRSSGARRQSLLRARLALSKEPGIFADTVSDLIDKSSPMKKELLKKKGITSTSSVSAILMKNTSQTLSTDRKSRKKEILKRKNTIAKALLITKKYGMQKKMCRTFHITPKLLKMQPKQPHKHRISDAIIKKVHSFYEENATVLPDKKLISKKTLKPVGFLTLPLQKLHAKFLKMHPNTCLGFSKFSSLRPSHIKLRGAMKYRACLCEYCTNVQLKLDALKHIALKNHLVSPFQDVHSFVDVTMCPKPTGMKHHNLECTNRKCKECGVKKIGDHPVIKELVAKQTTPVNWKRWTRISTETNGKKTSKMVLKAQDGILAELVSELVTEAESLAIHLFTASWQSSQFRGLTKNPPPGWCMMTFDFAENFSCRYQDEVQSVYWGYEAATLHPIIAVYLCPKCGDPKTHSLVMISNDKTHDYHAVRTFTTIAIDHLKKTLGPEAITQVVRFSDGCGIQYKSKGPFLDLSYAKSDYGVEFRHEYYGSRHGKGPSDGESGTIKRQATDAVLSRTAVISDAHDFFTFVRDNLTQTGEEETNGCEHFERTAFWVPNIDRSTNRHPTKTVPGTRQLHSIISVQPNVIAACNLSCFCPSCRSGGHETCYNSLYVNPHKKISLVAGQNFEEPSTDTGQRSLQETAHPETVDPGTGLPEKSHLETIQERTITPGQFVAVKFSKARGQELVVYMAIVLDSTGNDVVLKFMEQKATDPSVFAWPRVERSYTHPIHDIVGVLSPPEVLIVQRSVMYEFSEDELARIRSNLPGSVIFK
ncbi:uncharacterized protein [Diadema setosum]|uniref:uncharacterized protein n=1 Tax=Diadema setosum TaxID=31175 RepID=UPI003B3A8863